MTHQRIITGEGPDGRSRVDLREPLVPDTSFPSLTVSNLWRKTAEAKLPTADASPGPLPNIASLPPGEVLVFHLTYAPHSEASNGGEVITFTDERAGFHSTTSFDVQTCLEGEMTLLLDDEEVVLSAGDTAVLSGQSHAWANRGSAPATLMVTLIGGSRG